jgi:galactokinase
MAGSPQSLIATARETFSQHFGTEPTVFGIAPGRVELLGNHTDYNGGLVLAAALDRFTVVAGRPSPPDRNGIGIGEGQHAEAGQVGDKAEPSCRSSPIWALVYASSFNERVHFEVNNPDPGEPGSWSRYVQGVCWALRERYGPLTQGFEAVINGDVPLGTGLSSSASLQAALAGFLIQLGALPADSDARLEGEGDAADPRRLELARTLQRSENAFVGVSSGLLDQFSSLFGRAGHALFLDCRTLEHARLSLGDSPPAIVVCDSRTSRRLADGQYNQRRAECESVVTYFRERQATTGEAGMIRQLRDLSLDDLWEHWARLDAVGRLRARHVLSENERVLQGVQALRAGDVTAFGRLMSASHASSRDDFANSSPALDALIEAAEAAPGFLGGKLSGAGWAGCTVNLVQADQAPAFAESVQSTYERATGTLPHVHICLSASGAQGGSFDRMPSDRPAEIGR